MMNPKMMEKMMKQMGIKQQPIHADEVIIVQGDKRIRITNPQVVEVDMQGKKTWQVAGNAVEEEAGTSEEDLSMIMEKTGCSKAEAEKALAEANGDIAEAILALS